MAAMNRQQGVFVFEADTVAFANRKRAARACASCQKRKKRCPHTFTKPLDEKNGVGASDGAEKVLPSLLHKEPIRFVGDLNPESILSDLSSATNEREFSRIGTWVEQSRLIQQEQMRREGEAAAQITAAEEGGPQARTPEAQSAAKQHAELMKSMAVERYSKVERGRRSLTGHQRNYLSAVGAFRVLPKDTSDNLVKLYITHIDPVLPMIDGKKLLLEYAAGDASIWLIQAICLVACKTQKAIPYLKLCEDGPLLDQIAFARNLHTGLDAAMKADLEADRFQKIQIMTLMSLHNDGPGGIEESSAHLIQAIHDAQTTGVHICTPGRTRNDQGAMLWWTLWVFDKFNACLGGRPLMIAERDIDILEPSLENTPRSQAMGAWLQVGKLLDKVIEYYRPGADPDVTGWEEDEDFPSFVALTSNCNMDLIEPAHQSVLEICYNIIGILACRNGGPTTTSYIRRIACSDRIQQIISNADHALLPPIPLLPYAVSLSLTVAYRGLRDHYSDPAKALADLAVRCEILEGLSKTWWTADAMTKLGRKALKSLQNPASQSNPDLRLKQTAETGDVGDAMEAEVAACKFGPFSVPKNRDQGSNKPGKTPMTSKLPIPEIRTQPPQQQQSSTTTSRTSSGNALQVLSDAAATHNLTPTGSTTQRFAMLGVNDVEPDRKRRRFGVSPISFPGTHPQTNPFPVLNNFPTTTTSVSTPALDPSTSNTNTPATLLTTDPGNPDAFPDPFTFNPDYNDPAAFSDLDNLFDGFFDLSMPTMFQDPLFEGAAYFGVEDFPNMIDGTFQNIAVPGSRLPTSSPGLPTSMTMAYANQFGFGNVGRGS